MNNSLDMILNMIKNRGFEAYVVGGYVRDYLIFEKFSHDIDITTDAPLNVLLDLFKAYKPKCFKYDTLKFKLGADNIDIAHYRKEELVDGKLNVIFTNSIEIDSKRRDFTINAIYFDGNNYKDFHNGISDCNNRILRFIGNCKERLDEDPSRILRYFYFKVKYDFSLVDNEKDLIKRDALYYLNKCSLFDINKYFVKIIETNKLSSFIELLNSFEVTEFFFDNIYFDYSDINTFIINSKYKYFELLPNRFKITNNNSLNK